MELNLKGRLPEANIQAEFYYRCKQEKIPCMLEYTIEGARFDAIIHNNKRISHIVEIKSMTERAKRRRLARSRMPKQITKYLQHGLPVLVIINVDDIDKTIMQIKADLRDERSQIS
jgi:hypothetical protein